MKVCSENGCGGPTKARGLCNRHYLRYLHAGGEKKRVLFGPPSERFPKLYIVDEATGCWIWQSYSTARGHPTFGIDGRQDSAGRYSYEQHRGPLEKDQRVWNHCRTPKCVNPHHHETYPPKSRSPEQVEADLAAKRAEAQLVRDEAVRRYLAGRPKDERDLSCRSEDWGEAVCALLPNGEHAIIDAELEDWFFRYKWKVQRIGRNRTEAHVIASIGGRSVLLSRFLLDCPQGKLVDHRNHLTRDNRLANLRIASVSQNCANRRKLKPLSSVYKGVSWTARTRRWRASLGVDRKRLYLGEFDSELDAARAYNRAALEHFGQFAHLNDVGSSTVT